MLRYIIAYTCEFAHKFKTRRHLQAQGYRPGSIMALLSWCHTVAKYCQQYRHPWRLCVNRRAWVRWMTDSRPTTP